MKYDTPLQAIEASIEIWKRLQTTDQPPLFACREIDPQYDENTDLHNNPLCQYAHDVCDNELDMCEHCPLKKFFKEYRVLNYKILEDTFSAYCFCNDTPYRRWYESSTPEIGLVFVGEFVALLNSAKTAIQDEVTNV